MLKNIPKILNPQLLKVLCEMGHGENPQNIEMTERFAFYERARNAYAVVATGEERIYANILLKKGVVK